MLVHGEAFAVSSAEHEVSNRGTLVGAHEGRTRPRFQGSVLASMLPGVPLQSDQHRLRGAAASPQTDTFWFIGAFNHEC